MNIHTYVCGYGYTVHIQTISGTRAGSGLTLTQIAGVGAGAAARLGQRGPPLRRGHPSMCLRWRKMSIHEYAYVCVWVWIYRDICSADGSTHTESNTLYRKVKHRARSNRSHHTLAQRHR